MVVGMNSFDIATQIKELNRVPVGVAVVVTNSDFELLLIKRKGAHGKGTWSIPGGWVDAGEDPTTTCIRELAEEVGVGSNLHNHFTERELSFIGYTFDQHPEGIEDVCLYFWLHYVPTDMPHIREPDKISELRWIDINHGKIDWPQPLFPPLDNAIKKGLLPS